MSLLAQSSIADYRRKVLCEHTNAEIADKLPQKRPWRGCGQTEGRATHPCAAGSPRNHQISLSQPRVLSALLPSVDERYFSRYFSLCQGNQHKQTRTGEMKGLLKITVAHM